MKILITGAKGFVGRNLVEALKNIRDGKDKRPQYQCLLPLELFEYDKNSTVSDLEEYCSQTEFVFNLAGCNRPVNTTEFMDVNRDFLSTLLETLERTGNMSPVMLSSSTQATLAGRFKGSLYGESKLAAEKTLQDYGRRTGSKILIYRFPNLYGKWCRPNYNSAVATFCNNVAKSLPVTVNDESTELELLYIDDLVSEMLGALIGKEHHQADGFCHAGPTDIVTLGEIVQLLNEFKAARDTLDVPSVESGSFSKKLYSTYLSYLDPTDFSYNLTMNKDGRGSFTEILKTSDRGQLSVNVSKPGITKGQHWHNSKWEKFCVVSGDGLIQLRQIGLGEDGNPFPVIEYHVSGAEMKVVEMIPGYTHNIINLSNDKDLVTVMWCNEVFDPENPDTYREEV